MCDKGHKWSAVIRDRCDSELLKRKSGDILCPFCSKKKVSPTYNLKVIFPDIAKQWHYVNNAPLIADQVHPYSSKKVWWQCTYNNAHEWEDRVANRTLLYRKCPLCSKDFKMSYPARAIFYYLRQVFPQCECEIPEGQFTIDILIQNNIVIEYNGRYYHSSDKRKKVDLQKDLMLKKRGYQTIWIKDMEGIAKDSIFIEGNSIYFYMQDNNKNLDNLIKFLLNYLSNITSYPTDHIIVDHIGDDKKIDDNYYFLRKAKTLAVLEPGIAEEWSPSNKFSPDTVLCGSQKKALWLCPVCKQEYAATVANRVKNKSGCPYCYPGPPKKRMPLADSFPNLLAEWDTEKNYPLTPYNVFQSSKRKVYWRCKKGHEWQTAVINRTYKSGSNCPICNRFKTKKETCLQIKYPDLADYWHKYKNNNIKPNDVSINSNIKVWWQCPKGHEWEDSTKNMIKKQKNRNYCPYCNNRCVYIENCLLTQNPDLAKEWNHNKNGDLKPENIYYASTKKVWWRCKNGHEWQASVYRRNIMKSGCPYDSLHKVSLDNCLATNDARLLSEWNWEKNGTLTPYQLTKNSSQKVWWRCKNGYEWQNTVSKRRLRNQNCPYCSGRRVSLDNCLVTKNPILANEFHPYKNGLLTVYDISPGSGKKVWWCCKNGHEWQASVANRSKGRGCPLCLEERRRKNADK